MTDAVPSFYMACKEGEDNLTGEKNKNHRQRKIAYVLCCSLLVGAAVVCLKKWVFPRLGDTGETNTRITQIWSAEDYLAFVESLRAGDTYDGQYVNLQADIDLEGKETDWGLEGVVFAGIFDGNGHSIRNSGLIRREAPEVKAGISGVVCNVAVVDAAAEAGEASALSVEVLEKGKVLNCSADAAFAAEGQPGMIFNCALPQNIKEDFNGNLSRCAYYAGGQIDGWYRWAEDGTLTDTQAATLVSMEADVTFCEETRTLSAYYSDFENAWCVALPSGWTEATMVLRLDFTDGESLGINADGQIGEVTTDWAGISYPIRILFDENTPALFLDTGMSDAVSYLAANKENKVSGSWTMTGSDGAVLDSGKVQRLRGHGNDSFAAPKISYNLDFAKETDLLGMGASKRYVLLAGYRDNSLLAYKVTNDLSRSVGMDYAPITRFVQLYIDGNYMGMYFLTGRIEIGKNRFDLPDLAAENAKVNGNAMRTYPLREELTENGLRVFRELTGEPSDITGGYILERDVMDYDPVKSRFVSRRGWSLVLRSLPYASRGEINYIADYWQDFEDALYAADGYNEKGKYYTEYMDITSFADQWLFYELNTEISMSSSIYYYKQSEVDGDGLLHACYPWDMEHALRSTNHVTSGWIGRPNFGRGSIDEIWTVFYEHEDFAREVEKEWKAKFLPALNASVEAGQISDEKGLGSLDWYGQTYAASGLLNQSRWADCSYQAKVDKIRDTYDRRKNFMTKELSLYDTDYTWFFEEDGQMFGMTEEGELEPVGTDS